MKTRRRQGRGCEALIGQCPECHGPSSVTDSRTPIKDSRWIKRRRMCRKCGVHWGSLEIFEDEYERLTGIDDLVKQLAPLISKGRI